MSKTNSLRTGYPHQEKLWVCHETGKLECESRQSKGWKTEVAGKVKHEDGRSKKK